MFNRLMFILGAVFSFAFTMSIYNFVQKMPELQMVNVTIPLPTLSDPAPVKYAYTVKDLECLHENIFHEARNQSPLGQSMVGIVTIIRSRTEGYPSTICGVVYEHAQFSWTLKRHPVNMKNKIEAQAWWFTGLIAQNLLLNSTGIDKTYKNLVYYHKTTIHPKWSDSLTMRKEFTVDDHVFYSKVSDESRSFVLR
jgi:spore germination cell wall hydrolase CwlJ-like protein